VTRVAEPEPESYEFIETVLVSVDEFRERLRAGALTNVDLGCLALDHLGRLSS
jgi:hypothetical protein